MSFMMSVLVAGVVTLLKVGDAILPRHDAQHSRVSRMQRPGEAKPNSGDARGEQTQSRHIRPV